MNLSTIITILSIIVAALTALIPLLQELIKAFALTE